MQAGLAVFERLLPMRGACRERTVAIVSAFALPLCVAVDALAHGSKEATDTSGVHAVARVDSADVLKTLVHTSACVLQSA